MAGLADRSTLASGTNGTGPFVLEEAVANDHYTFSARDDYTWGPDGATSELPGFPSEVVVRIIENESTAANLLLSGEVDIATIAGADRQRVESEGYFVTEQRSIVGEFFFNHMEGLPTADVAVRQALMGAVDLQELMSVQTAGNGVLATGLAEILPKACPGDTVGAILTAGADVEAAAQLLDEAGWVMGDDGVREKDGAPLTIRAFYVSSDRELGAVDGAGDGRMAGARCRRAIAGCRRGTVQHDRLRDEGVGRVSGRPQPRRPERRRTVRLRPAAARRGQLLRRRQPRVRGPRRRSERASPVRKPATCGTPPRPSSTPR